MADAKLTSLTEETTPAGTDIVYVVIDPGTTPASRKCTIANLVGALGADAEDVTYTPAVLANWTGSADPGATDDALDQLASRAKTLETASHAAVTLDADAAVLLDLSTQEIGLDTQTANYVFAGPASGAANEPTFRALVPLDLATSGDDGDVLTVASGALSWAAPHAAVTLDADAAVLLDLSTQEIGLDTQTANYVFAGPETGAANEPTFRALVDADIPAAIVRSSGATTAATGQAQVFTYGIVANEGSNDSDTRVEGNNDENLVYVDAGNDRVGVGLAAPAAKLHVDQSSATGAVPVLTVDQADVSEEFIRFIGESTTDASQSLVDAADMEDPGAIVGWLKIYVEDTQATNGITDGVYYIPFYASPTHSP